MAVDTKYGRVTVERGKLPEEEPVFLFRGQDRLAPQVVRYYADLVEQETGNHAFAEAVRAEAQRLEAWPVKKLPD